MKIDLGKNELIHFVGIGGIGMSGLALIMNGLGYKVQGSDITNNRNIERLSEKKIKVFIKHKKEKSRHPNFSYYILRNQRDRKRAKRNRWRGCIKRGT